CARNPREYSGYALGAPYSWSFDIW
nr:immunoglobulin heavy chain junction region [Macaca mulatta]MOX92013.1 immunoglobulin heavy chain junction region [Macaca mulatta]MOX92189.1 immunoglobulin heavy chain junction region [Macaca mulatta]MOX93278.1 immunoglobulin heavy chain junction region [Macaca mulatta]MOX93549.1 immunoglobulin heavy chain junction region [Macaca mulatta]